MIRLSPSASSLLLALLLTAIAACTSAVSEVTSTTEPPAVSSLTVPEDEAGPTESAAAARTRAEIVGLVATVEEIRGLTFLQPPEIDVVDPSEFELRVKAFARQGLGSAGMEPSQRFYRMMGMLGPEDELETWLEALAVREVPGYYEPAEGVLVVAAAETPLRPSDKAALVNEIVQALVDQHFGAWATLADLVEEGLTDEATALRALAEGDALYYQVVFAEALGHDEEAAIAVDLIGAADPLEGTPGWLHSALMFPYDEGFRFVAAVVAQGGSAALDAAYESGLSSTEQILHPSRLLRGEVPRRVGLPAIELAGYEVLSRGAFGELNLRLLLFNTEPRGYVTQLGEGWAGDDHVVLYTESDVAFALEYLGDTERDGIEVTEALIRHVRAVMGGGDGVGEGGGLLFPGESGPYVFIDRIVDRVILVAATDPQAGAALREMVAPG